MENLIIVGSGPAGYTAAIYAARGNLNPVLISGKLPGGLLTQTSEVENFPGFPESVLGFDLMDKMLKQSEKFGAKMVYDTVKDIKINADFHTLELESGTVIDSKSVIIATGSSPKWMGLESEQRLMTKGVTACATCDGAFYRGDEVVVIGGGDSAVEEALFLTKFASKVTMIHRREQLRASKIMVERALKNKKIEIAWNSVVVEVLGDDSVEGVKIQNVNSGEIKIIPCKGYFAALGHIPNTSVFKGRIDMDEKGFIILKNNSSYTNVPGVFAAGDCADNVYKQAITAAGMGCRAAIDAERWLEAL